MILIVRSAIIIVRRIFVIRVLVLVKSWRVLPEHKHLHHEEVVCVQQADMREPDSKQRSPNSSATWRFM